MTVPEKARCQEDTASFTTERLIITSDSIKLKSSLIIPWNVKKPPVVLIIAGSGPTDMNGNNATMQNNCLKLLALGLEKEGIATMRYDKRSVPANQNTVPEQGVVFEDFVMDAMKFIDFLKKDNRLGDVYILGHSQGSLVGMLAAEKIKVSGFISVAGAGEPIGDVIVRQINEQSTELGAQARIIVDSLVTGHDVRSVSPMLLGIFRPSIQPFLRSWLKYDPAREIARLNTRVLILQGTNDIQVTKQDALNLKAADPDATLKFIDGMNHIMKKAPEDRRANLKTYYNPDLPVMPELIRDIADFVRK